MTYKEYLSEVDDFINSSESPVNSKWYLDTAKVKNHTEKIGKCLVDWDTRDIMDFFISGGAMSNSMVTNYLIVLIAFYDYEISKGVIRSNPCDDQALNARNIVENIQEGQLYYTPEDIEKVISSINMNYHYNLALLLSYYEGVAMTSADIIDLKLSGFHPKKKTITTKSGVKTISDRLTTAYLGLNDITEIEGLTRHTKAEKLHPDDLFPATGKAFKLFLNRRLDSIGEEAGLKLKCFNLYYSGFLNFVADRVGVEKCISLVMGNDRYGCDELIGYAKEYMLQIPTNKIRKKLRGIAMTMKDRLLVSE